LTPENKLKEKSALKSKYHQPTIPDRFADYSTVVSKNRKVVLAQSITR